jgi:hypothetical protein
MLVLIKELKFYKPIFFVFSKKVRFLVGTGFTLPPTSRVFPSTIQTKSIENFKVVLWAIKRCIGVTVLIQKTKLLQTLEH